MSTSFVEAANRVAGQCKALFGEDAVSFGGVDNDPDASGSQTTRWQINGPIQMAGSNDVILVEFAAKDEERRLECAQNIIAALEDAGLTGFSHMRGLQDNETDVVIGIRLGDAVKHAVMSADDLLANDDLQLAIQQNRSAFEGFAGGLF